MIHHIEGNLLGWTHWNAIFSSCNAQGVMGSGLAKAIRDAYPAVYTDYRASGFKLGSISTTIIGDKTIFSAITQDRYGYDGSRYVNYEALYSTLEEARDRLLTVGVLSNRPSLGIPHLLSSDRAGGSWKVVSAMVEDLFGEVPLDLYIVKLTS